MDQLLAYNTYNSYSEAYRLKNKVVGKIIYSRFIDLVSDDLYLYICRLVRDGTYSCLKDLENDILHEVIIDMYSTPDIYKPNNPNTFRAWLHKICRNHMYDLAIKKHYINRDPLEAIATDVFPEIADPCINSNLRIDFQNAINNLSDLEKKIIVFKYYYCLSYDTIKKKLDISYSQVKNSLHSARKKIKEHLKDYF